MKYSVLAENYEKLEKTSSKLEKAHIIAELLKETAAELLPEVVLLLNGRVFPAWSEEELGVANQLMIKAIAKSCGIDDKKIVKEFNKCGDLGLVVEQFSGSKKQTTLGMKELTVENVFGNLQMIAKQTGKGSQDRKMDLIAELLIQARPKEARYIVRTVLSQLRIGVAEGIVRDAIAEAFDVDSKKVEKAWFLDPDYGEIAKIANEKGEKGLEKVKIEIGRPVMVQLAEKAPSLKDAVNSFDNVALEYKYDGARMLIQKDDNKIWIFTRRFENITRNFPDVVEYCKKGLKAKNCVIDGEALAIDKKTGKPLPFQTLSQRIKRKYDIKKTAKEIPVELNVFDVIYLDGKALFDLTLEERREKLSKIIKKLPGKMKMAQRLVTKDLKKAQKFYDDALKEGQEGLMVKDLEAKYLPGRRVAGGWLKVKPILETLDLVVIGGTWGTGKRTGWLGSFILGCRDPITGNFMNCGMLGTGVKEKKSQETDTTFKELTKMLKPYIESEKGNEVKIKPKIVLEVAYEEIQKSPTYKSGFALRFPRMVKVRWDKGPEEADDLKRLENIYNIQKGKK